LWDRQDDMGEGLEDQREFSHHHYQEAVELYSEISQI
jgi:hypothetical protein